MRGLEKKVIYVKDTGSRVFREAYFVLRGDVPAVESDLAEEAARILRERERGYPAPARRVAWQKNVGLFLAGAGAAASFFGLVAFVLALL